MKRKIEAQLLAWKNQTADRLPLIVNGARQVGKTYILRKFGEEQFNNVVYINLETNLTIASYFNENIQPERLLRYLEASTGERIISGETLIIFDEIQSCERALVRWRLSPFIHWILRSISGPGARNSSARRFAQPMAPWSRCPMPCIRRPLNYIGSI